MLRTLISAPWSSSRRMVASTPAVPALPRAVSFRFDRTRASAPRSRRDPAGPALPLVAANIRAVSPAPSLRLTSMFLSAIRRSAATSPRTAAAMSGVIPFAVAMRGSAPCSRRNFSIAVPSPSDAARYSGVRPSTCRAFTAAPREINNRTLASSWMAQWSGTFGRSVDAMWSPGVTHVAITDHSGSSDSKVFVAELASGRLTDVEQEMRRTLRSQPPIYVNGHRYFTALRWQSATRLFFEVRAYDLEPDREVRATFAFDVKNRIVTSV